MRPLVAISLLLVLVLGAVLYMFMSGGDSTPGTTAAPVAQAPARAPTPKSQTLTPVEQQEKGPVAVQLPEQDEERESVAAPHLSNSLTGVIYNDERKPLSGAKVVLSRDPFMGEQLSMMWFLGKEPTGKFISTVSDSEGRYAFKSIEPATDYFMLVDHPDFRQAQEELIVVGESGEFPGPDVYLAEGALLNGYVIDIGENPVPDAMLYLDSAYMMGEDPQSPDRMTAKTDELGFYEFRNVGAGPRNLSVFADGYAMSVQHNLKFDGSPGEVVEHTFRLDLGHPIAGRVFGPENEGIAGAKLMAMMYSNQQSSRGEAVTNENGEFQIDNLAQGSYSLTVDAKGYRVARHNRVQVGDLNVQIEMIKQACVSGRIVNQSSGDPIDSFTATVFHTNPTAKGQSSPIYEAVGVQEEFDVDANGYYTLCGLDSGTFTIKVRAQGLAPTMSEPFTVVDGQVLSDIVVKMNEGGSITGRLVGADGSPIQGARISSHDDEHGGSDLDPFLGGLVTSRTTERKTRSDADGNFKLKLLNPGTYRIQVSHPSFTTEIVRGLRVTENADASAGSITLKPGGMVRGKVYNQAGELLPQGFVQLLRSDGDEVYTYNARTTPQGQYSFEHVRPGSYKLTATRGSPNGGGDAFEAILDQQYSEVLINVVEGTTVTRDLNLGN